MIKHMQMRHIYIFIMLVAAVVIPTSCQHSDEFKELPDPIAKFVSQYWPNPAIASYTHPAADKYVVIIKNGPSLTFNGDYEWTELDGNGLPLPRVLLFDRMPSPLYRYLEETTSTEGVFKIVRTPRLFTLTLLDSILTYDPATGEIRGR